MPEFSTPISQKTFFKGDKVQLKWNKEGTSLIVLAQTEVDKSGKSYYGETTLYLMSGNGGFDSRIELGRSFAANDRYRPSLTCSVDKDGPIHDVTWSPNSKEFGVVYGYMPAKTTLFNTRAKAVHTFPLGPRNTIIFSPHGRFVLVAGFGNLAGQMDIYDIEKDFHKLCTIEASNASVCEWSPDGKHILTATTSPRLRVDNGVRVWHVGGGLMYNEDLSELYHVTWRPQSATSHPLEASLHPMPTPHASALQYLGTVKTPSKAAGAYRPPGARGQITPIAFRREDEGGAAYVSNGTFSTGLHAATFGKPRKREVPGAEAAAPEGSSAATPAPADGDENLSKAAAKNKKKREAKKAKDAAEKAAGLAPAPEDGQQTSPGRSPERKDRKPHEPNRPKGHHPDGRPRSQTRAKDAPARDQQQRPANTSHPKKTVEGTSANGTSKPVAPAALAAATAAAAAATTTAEDEATPDVTVTSPGGVSPHDKKVRALLKKLRAIDDLKMRRAGGEKLEGTQIMKMATEEEVRRELNGLGWNE